MHLLNVQIQIQTLRTVPLLSSLLPASSAPLATITRACVPPIAKYSIRSPIARCRLSPIRLHILPLLSPATPPRKQASTFVPTPLLFNYIAHVHIRRLTYRRNSAPCNEEFRSFLPPHSHLAASLLPQHPIGRYNNIAIGAGPTRFSDPSAPRCLGVGVLPPTPRRSSSTRRIYLTVSLGRHC
ncbi:hypothetical protein B0H10DRAFT_1985212 [Mycena sp. CBHHK59/15]|nr:hypothetical protein B0H10DRAFT_1985212 [Mycena sp. CBHHK59/15]